MKLTSYFLHGRGDSSAPQPRVSGGALPALREDFYFERLEVLNNQEGFSSSSFWNGAAPAAGVQRTLRSPHVASIGGDEETHSSPSPSILWPRGPKKTPIMRRVLAPRVFF